MTSSTPEVTWTEPFLDRVLAFIPLQSKTIIDVGAGKGIVGALCKIYRSPSRLVALEIFEPYIQFLTETLKVYDEVIKQDLRRLPLPFANGEFDVAVALEVIEHLEKNQGEMLLDELMRIANRVIVSTPGRFHEQPAFDRNPYQRHLSRWSVKDFRRRGFVVRGVGDLLIFGREIRYLSFLLRSLTYPLPRLSSALLAVWDRSGYVELK